jgi:hypothetical protein
MILACGQFYMTAGGELKDKLWDFPLTDTCMAQPKGILPIWVKYLHIKGFFFGLSTFSSGVFLF